MLVDIVDSRHLTDRAETQSAIEAAFARADAIAPASQPLQATVGDEFQGVWPDLAGALRGTLAARLALPDGVDCRFGLGLGEIRDIPGARAVRLQEGEGWTLARTAIATAHRNAEKRVPSCRSWAESTDARDVAVANGYLLARDAVLAGMSARARRLAFGTLQGAAQRDLADAEQVTPSAVSQALRSSGATSLIAGFDALGATGQDG